MKLAYFQKIKASKKKKKVKALKKNPTIMMIPVSKELKRFVCVCVCVPNMQINTNMKAF
jgi:hypothetical protein